MKISELSNAEKPRERLINKGAEYLSNEELLAIILRCGTKNKSSKELASTIIKEMGGIENLKNATINNLNKINGMGCAKSSEVIAALELGKRVYYVKNIAQIKITLASEIYELFRNEMCNIDYEKFGCIYLDAKNKVITYKTLFIGTLDSSTVHPREIFKEALKVSANSIICIHNHPSGDATPSKEDKVITNMLINSGEMMGIKLLDHIIFGINNYYSFKSMNK